MAAGAVAMPTNGGSTVPQIVYVGPFDEVDVPAHRLGGIKPGEPVEVSDEAAAALLAQADNWQPAKPGKSTPAAPGKEG